MNLMAANFGPQAPLWTAAILLRRKKLDFLGDMVFWIKPTSCHRINAVILDLCGVNSEGNIHWKVSKES